jgi:hypothetical protein
MNTNDKAVEKTELIINALEYATTHKLDINKKEDVKKILDILDPEHVTEAEVNEFMKLLQNADTFLEMTAKQKHKITKLPN